MKSNVYFEREIYRQIYEVNDTFQYQSCSFPLSRRKLKFEFGQETVANLKMHLALSSEILQVKSVAK